MSPHLSALTSKIPASATMGAASASTTHPDPISLAVGEPLEAPPQEVMEAAVQAIHEGRTRYGPVAGLPELRELLAAKHQKQALVPTHSDQVVITAGGKPALAQAMQCLLEPDDEVLIFAPYWPSFEQQVQWCRAVPVIVPHDGSTKIDTQAAAKLITPRTRMLVINSPLNPTAQLVEPQQLREVAELAEKHDLWILSDEVYLNFVFAGGAHSLLKVTPEVAHRTVVVDSFSKRFSMTGYRLGSAIGPPDLIGAMINLSSATTTHANMIAQYAGIAAMHMDGSWERRRLDDYSSKLAFTLRRMRGWPGVAVETPDAALYVFPNVERVIKDHGLKDDAELTKRLREDVGLRLVPGSAFGAPGYLRVSYGLERERLEEAISRFEDWLKT